MHQWHRHGQTAILVARHSGHASTHIGRGRATDGHSDRDRHYHAVADRTPLTRCAQTDRNPATRCHTLAHCDPLPGRRGGVDGHTYANCHAHTNPNPGSHCCACRADAAV